MTFSKIGQELLSKFKQAQGKKPKKCFVGFDGFTDNIISLVDKTISPNNQTYITKICDFGHKILDAAGKSCNFELIVKQTKIGGNAPIFTNALLEGGHQIIFAGAIGTPCKIEPLFKKMSDRCTRVFPLSESGKTDALEFQDGKIILGKLQSLKEITFENLLKQIPLAALIDILNDTDLLVSANWTMLPYMTDIWKHLTLDVVPKLTPQKTPRYLFVDLADPAKRTDKDLIEALETLGKLSDTYKIILGLNISEAEILSKLLGMEFLNNTPSLIKDSSLKLFEKLKIFRLIVHHATFALSLDQDDYIYFQSFYTEHPILKTGAGDNFNAGYCNALLYDLTKEDSLISALATSGFYVRFGHSPSMQQLADFLTHVTKRHCRDSL